jgi:sn-glycerol 3-phosphate transport system permease protein
MKRHVRDILVVLLALIVLFPLWYAFSASLFARGDFTATPARLFPSTVTFSNYQRAFRSSNLGRYLYNSIVSAVLGTGLRLAVCMAAAYSLTTFEFKGRDAIFVILVSTMLFPGDALLIQNYQTIQKAGLTDTYLGLIITGILSPTAIFILRQYFLTVSPEYREAAYLEGCSDIRFMTTLLVPMSQSIIIALCVQSFTQIFNDYLWPLLVTNTEAMRTVQVGITMLGFADTYDYGPQFAAIVVLTVPMIIVFLALRNHINESVSTRFSGR